MNIARSRAGDANQSDESDPQHLEMDYNPDDLRITSDFDMFHLLIPIGSVTRLNYFKGDVLATLRGVLIPGSKSRKNGFVPGTNAKLSTLLSVNIGYISLGQLGTVPINILFDTMRKDLLLEPIFPLLQRLWKSAIQTILANGVSNVPAESHYLAKLLLKDRKS